MVWTLWSPHSAPPRTANGHMAISSSMRLRSLPPWMADAHPPLPITFVHHCGRRSANVRRDTREKIVVSLDEVNEKLAEVLETMQNDMLEKAKAFLASHINDAHDYNEFKAIAETKPGFIRAMWCGDEACENKIKEDTTVTSRCMPFGDQEQISDVCVCCGKPAHKLVYWGKAY